MTSEAELIARLHRQFPNANPPEQIAENEDDLESQAVERDFLTREWDSLEPAMLDRNWQSLHFMTAPAFVYYIPAYLQLCLTDPEPGGVLDTVVSALTVTGDAELDMWTKRRQEGFTDGQREVIADFLSYMDERYQGDIDGLMHRAAEQWQDWSSASATGDKSGA